MAMAQRVKFGGSFCGKVLLLKHYVSFFQGEQSEYREDNGSKCMMYEIVPKKNPKC